MTHQQMNSPSPSRNNLQNNYNTTIQLAVNFCEANNPEQLRNYIFQTKISVNTLVPLYKYKNIRRMKVPLISVAVSHNSLDCVKLLVQLNADIEAQDVFIISFIQFYSFFLIQFFFLISYGVFF